MSLLSSGTEKMAPAARPTRWVIALFVALGLLGTVGWFNLRHIDRMQETAKWVHRTERVRDALDVLLLQLHNVQGNERGYVVTGETVYLDGFHAAMLESEGQFKTIQKLLEENPVQRSHCAKLQGLIAKVYLIAGRQVELRRKAGLEAARQDLSVGAGRQVMSQISSVLGEMDEVEAELLEERSKIAQHEVWWTRLLTISGTGLSFLLLGGVFFLVLRENTLRLEAQVELGRLNEELHTRAAQVEEANKELESFSYSVSHDLRAPLRHVHGYVEMLQRVTDGQLHDKAKRYLKTIADASIEMGQLIDDLLAFSRMGRVEMQQTRVALDPLVRDIIEQLEMQAKDRKITWNISPLPDVYGDAAMIKQVLANLIGNAVKYTRKREHATIELLGIGEDHGEVIFCVRDNGAGFDMRYAHKLFGVFQRLHRVDEFEGTGIGLATVRRIVARHGGRTWAEGKLEQGASFYFTLKPASNKTNSHDCNQTNSPGGR